MDIYAEVVMWKCWGALFSPAHTTFTYFSLLAVFIYGATLLFSRMIYSSSLISLPLWPLVSRDNAKRMRRRHSISSSGVSLHVVYRISFFFPPNQHTKSSGCRTLAIKSVGNKFQTPNRKLTPELRHLSKWTQCSLIFPDACNNLWF